MLFALLYSAKGDIHYVQLLFKALSSFSSIFGLNANASKSCLYFSGLCEDIKHEILGFTSMSEGFFPFRYLGVPLHARKL